MKAFLILEDGNVFEGTSIGSAREVISEIVFNTSMTGYLEVLTDPSYAGQAVVMTYPLIGNYGINKDDMESRKAWPDGFIVREIARRPSNFRCEMSLRDFLVEQEITGITGIDTRALTRILRESGTMNGMITTNEDFVLEEVLPRIREYKQQNVVERTTTISTKVLPGDGCRFLQPLGVVAHHGVVQHVHAHGGQRLRQLLRIRVGDAAQQQLGTHGDDLCVIGHRITSFDDLPDGIFVSRFFFVPPAGNFLPTAGKSRPSGATSQNGQQKPPSLT